MDTGAGEGLGVGTETGSLPGGAVEVEGDVGEVGGPEGEAGFATLEGGDEGNLSRAIEEPISAAGGGSEERPYVGKGLEARGDREGSPKLSPKLEALKAKNKARSAASRAAGAGVQAPSPPPMSDSPVPVGRKTRANSAGAGAGPARPRRNSTPGVPDPGSPKGSSARGPRVSTEQLSAKFSDLQQQVSQMHASMDLRNAAKREQDLQNLVTELRHKLLQMTDAKNEGHKRLIDERRSSERAEKRLREGYEGRLRGKQKEIYELTIRVQELEGTSAKSKVLAGGPAANLSEGELSDLRREIAEQEQLLKGYQTENESAIEQLKVMREEAAEKQDLMAQENGRLARELAVAAEEGRRATATKAAWLEEKLGLDQALRAAQEATHAVELRLKEEVDRHRREKQELHAKSAGVDLKKMEAENDVLAQVQQEMERLKEQHRVHCEDLERKLRWYAENQQIIADTETQLQAQAQNIQELEAALEKARESSGAVAGSKKGGKSSSSKQEAKLAARVKELEAELDGVREALGKRNPNSLAALIQASKPSVEESRIVQDLRAQIEDMQNKESDLILQHEKQLRSLRQEHEKMRLQRDGSEGRKRRIKELERQLDEVRTFYNKKVKGLQQKLELASVVPQSARKRRQGAGGGQPSPPASGETDSAGSLEESGQHLLQQRLEGALAEKARLEERLLSAEGSASVALRDAAKHDSEVESLENQNYALQQENRLLQEQLQWAQEGDRDPGAPGSQALATKLAAASLTLANTQKSYHDAVEKCALVQAQHQSHVERLEEDFSRRVGALQQRLERAEADGQWQGRAEAAIEEKEALKVECSALQAEVESLRASKEWTPQAAEFSRLEQRLSEMEAKHAAKEAQWRGAVQETQRVAEMQHGALRRRWELAFEAKSAELEGFRREIDGILLQARGLQR